MFEAYFILFLFLFVLGCVFSAALSFIPVGFCAAGAAAGFVAMLIQGLFFD